MVKRRKARSTSSARSRAARRPKTRRATARPKRRSAAGRRAAPRRPKAPKTTPRKAKAPEAAVPSGIGLVRQHLDYTSQSLDEVKRFYTEWLGFTKFDYRPEAQYLTVSTGPGSSLGFMPPMPGPPEEWRPPREPALYLIVQDVDRAHRQLQSRGVSFDQAPTDMLWGHRVALLRDPEGRRVCLAQILRRRRPGEER